MSEYPFQFEDFAVSNDGVHLLRSGFNFKTIPYEEVKRATLERSAEIKNAYLILVVGILLGCFALYQCRWIVEILTTPQEHTIYIETFVLPIIPAFIGAYCIYTAVKKGPMLKLEEGSKVHKLRLRSMVKNNLTSPFEKYLLTKLGSRLHVDNSMSIYNH